MSAYCEVRDALLENLARARKLRLKNNGNVMIELKKRVGLSRGSKSDKKKTGFTLIEIIISLGVFAVVAVVAVGALISIIDSNKKSQTSNTVIVDLGFALESFSRELRVGSAYHCTQNNSFDNLQDGKSLLSQACDTYGGEIIAFKSSESDPNDTSCPLVFAYRFLWDSTVTPNRFHFDKAKQTECNGFLTFFPIISSNVIITDYRLGVFFDPNTQPYPLAFIRLMGYVGVSDRDKTEFDLQTTVSQRILE
jgi:prepilin-type N-terminal cleavage/methylation domain-containing protein